MAGSIKRVVVDASVVLARLLPDEKSSRKLLGLYKKFLENKVNFVAPNLLAYEVANGLRSAVKQKRISKGLAGKMLSMFLALPIEFFKVDYEKVFLVAMEKNLSVYDASYVWLARTKRIKLASLDRRLI